MSEIILRVENLRKAYGEVVPLKNISLDIKRGEVISIIGGSGTGKSTFLRMLNLLERPTAGKIFFAGEEITAANFEAETLRQRIGMIFQSFNLFAGLTAIENAIVAPVTLKGLSTQEAYDKARILFENVGLGEKIFNYPDELSGGQQQRAAIVRALMMEPEILLFDEPTSALDPTMVGEVLAVIRMLAKQGLTMLIVTHEMNFAREVATRVLFFVDGEIYEQGTPAEIFDAPKRPKTVAFIRRQKYFHYDITSRTFDLPAMQSKIQTFAEKYGLTARQTNRLQLCSEELSYEMLDGCFNAGDEISATLDIVYVEAEKILEVSFTCGGKSHNPFDKPVDDLRGKILLELTTNITCSFDGGLNRVRVELLSQ